MGVLSSKEDVVFVGSTYKVPNVPYDAIKTNIYGRTRHLGHGSYGQVVEAEWNNEKVAIKVCARAYDNEKMDDGFWDRQVDVWTRIKTPRILELKAVSRNDLGNMVFVMPLCKENLTELLLEEKNNPTLSFSDKLRIAIEISEGVRDLHSQCILHRDIKGANILMTHDGSTKIADFDMSKVHLDSVINTKDSYGTLAYMSPEVWKKKPYDTCDDVYSLGVILHQLTTCVPPYRGWTEDQIESVLATNKRPDFPQNCCREFQDVVEGCWHKVPSKRWEISCVISHLKALQQRLKDEIDGKDFVALKGDDSQPSLEENPITTPLDKVNGLEPQFVQIDDLIDGIDDFKVSSDGSTQRITTENDEEAKNPEILAESWKKLKLQLAKLRSWVYFDPGSSRDGEHVRFDLGNVKLQENPDGTGTIVHDDGGSLCVMRANAWREELYRVVNKSGVCYRETPIIQDRIGPSYGVLSNDIVTATKVKGDWIQLRNGYWLPVKVDGQVVLQKITQRCFIG